jgi:hypothetical protein
MKSPQAISQICVTRIALYQYSTAHPPATKDENGEVDAMDGKISSFSLKVCSRFPGFLECSLILPAIDGQHHTREIGRGRRK